MKVYELIAALQDLPAGSGVFFNPEGTTENHSIDGVSGAQSSNEHVFLFGMRRKETEE